MNMLLCSARTPEIYVSYAWGPGEKVVDDMCGVMQAEGYWVIRDRTAMKYDDRISDFMKCLSRGDLIVVILSAKYLQSNYCMTELHGIFQRASGDKGEFLDRIIPVSLADAKFASWRDRTEIAKHWEEEFQGDGEISSAFRSGGFRPLQVHAGLAQSSGRHTRLRKRHAETARV
jgi:internalin A